MVKYSTEKNLYIEVDKSANDGSAPLTHYFQNHINGASPIARTQWQIRVRL